MNINRTVSVARRVAQEMRHDKRTVALMLFAPIMAMFLFGLAFSGEVHDVDLIVVNLDSGAQVGPGNVSISENILSHIDTDITRLKEMDDLEDAIAAVERGEAYGVIYFPPDFTKDLMSKLQDPAVNSNTTIDLRLDNSNVNVAQAIITNVNEAVLEAMEEQGQSAPMMVDTSEPIYGKDAEFMDFFVPGIMAFVVYILTTLLTLITFVSERTSGTLERMAAAPVRSYEIVLGYVLTFSVVGMVQAGILLMIGVLVFKILIVGNILLAFLVIALLAVVCQAMGIMLSSLAKREAQAVQFFPFIVMPAFLLSGIFWPLEAIPKWLRPLSYLIPVTYAISACRSVILRGWGLDKIWLDLLALAGFALGFMILAFFTLKRRN